VGGNEKESKKSIEVSICEFFTGAISLSYFRMFIFFGMKVLYALSFFVPVIRRISCAFFV